MESTNATTATLDLVVFSTHGERQLVAAFYGIIAVVGTLGNCVVILALLLSRKLRTVSNVFVVNLSVADLISSLSIPWQAVAVLSADGWPLPDWMCAIGALGVLVPIGCSLNTLTLIAINRFVMVNCTKATYRKLYQRRWLVLMVVCAWALPVAVASVPLMSDFVDLGFDAFFSTCGWDSSNSNSPTYALVLAVVSYPVQLVTIIACYLALFVRLCKYHRTISMRVGPEQPGTSQENSVWNISGVAPSQQRPQIRGNYNKRQTEVTKNLFYVVCAFFLCTTPYVVCITQYGTYKLLPYVTILLFANSCLNPFIYATKHPDFKKVLACILRCRFSSISGKIHIF
ncbi:melatonin receptor type 1B-B-like [Acanthaster planci]|uniref:Melatonin receptor type 1B-B-like n=1 Tax=Acanthaster planci TaxID=133434 RepID=A0A8B7YE42_ACAPL|nr:melatonin receptor type 1B-B-like [Acanthaster planci]